jgi:hypothetical protein
MTKYRICPESSRRAEVLTEMGFLVAGVEVAMIEPISPAGAAAISAPITVAQACPERSRRVGNLCR